MTLLIGADLKQYTLIAADTRVTQISTIFGNHYEDGDHKIALCGLGLISGSGYVDALDAVTEELMAREITHTDEILEIIRNKALPQIDDIQRQYPSEKRSTCFFISYATGSAEDDVSLRLCVTHPQWDYEMGIIKDVSVIMPADSNRDEANRYDKFLRENIIQCDEDFSNEEYFNNIIKNFFVNSMLIARCFNEIYTKSSEISSDLDIAALLLNGDILYAYGESLDIMNGNLHQIALIQERNKTHFLTPDTFSENKHIIIELRVNS